MTVLLDARTSQNASFSNSISVPILVGTQGLFGQIGLNVPNATGPIRVQINGTIAVQLPLAPVATTITIRIVRGTTPSSPVIYSSSENLDVSILGPQLLTFVSSDFNVPKPASGLLVYTAFITSNVVGTNRVGPESLNGIAYSG
jgi:hypothetical protein